MDGAPISSVTARCARRASPLQRAGLDTGSSRRDAVVVEVGHPNLSALPAQAGIHARIRARDDLSRRGQ